MRRLTLIRHAKSSWKDASLADFERPLNQRGLENAQEMGKRLLQRQDFPDMLLASPARRARDTAQILARELGWSADRIIFEPQIYEADITTLLGVTQALEDRWQHVALVGHNPGFTTFANWLADAAIANMPTCAVLALALEIENWTETGTGSGRVLDFDFPKRVRKF